MESSLPSWLFPLIVAPAIGSFLGVLIRRLPVGDGVALGRSRCERCKHELAPTDMVPILSFLMQRGHCRYCAQPIAPMHLHVELAALAIAAVSAGIEHQAGGEPMRLWADCVLGWTLLALAWIDAGHFVLPDILTVPLVLFGLGWWLYADPASLAGHAIAAVAGYLVFRLVEIAYRSWRGRDGLGQGDAKLLAAGGAWVGLDGLGPVILVAALLGLGIAAVQSLRGRAVERHTKIPFGPCLAAAIWLVFVAWS